MKDILAACNQSAVWRFTAERVLLAFDYDGTLAPITNDPRRAVMRSSTKSLLARVARVYQCAVITGRRRRSAAGFIRGVGIRWIVGNHGLEGPGPLARNGQYQKLVAQWRQTLRDELGQVAGLAIEDKGLSLSVHLRGAKEPRAAKRRVDEVVSRLPDCRAEPGIEVVNLLPRGAPDKGDALVKLLRLSGCSHAIYVGDDVTDEAVFALRRPPVLSVCVGGRRDSRAKYRLADQRRMDDFLRLLFSARFEDRGGLRRGGTRRAAQPCR